MGTWGEGAFDNDTAADWAWEFDGADLESGMRLIEAALGHAAATPADGYLTCQDGDLAVAAAELVAYIADEPVDETAYNTTALDWADRVGAVTGHRAARRGQQAGVDPRFGHPVRPYGS